MPDAAARELKEETSLEAERFTFVNLVNDHADPVRQDVHYVHVGFLAHNVKGDAKCLEPDHCFEWKWFPLHALPQELFFGHTRLIELFLQKLPFGDSKKE